MADFLRCKDCKHDKGKCVGVSRRARHKNCFEPKVMTNADRIRAMSDEELAVFIRAVIMAEDCPVTGCDCDKCFFKDPCFNGLKWHGKETEWLKQPAEGGTQ